MQKEMHTSIGALKVLTLLEKAKANRYPSFIEEARKVRCLGEVFVLERSAERRAREGRVIFPA